MILSTQTKAISRRLGHEAAIRMIAKAGFDAYDFTMGRIQFAFDSDSSFGENDKIFHEDGYAEHILKLRKIADEEGIICNQAHAPWPSQTYGDDEYNERVFGLTIRSMECASILGAKIIVVHPIKGCPEGVDEFELNVEYFNKLLPYCKKYNIKIAVENMFIEDKKREHIVSSICGMSDEHRDMCDRLDKDWFVACLDIGHSGLSGDEAYKAIYTLGHKRLKALHVHDNDYRKDLHTLPYMGKVDWDRTLKALADIDYSGDFTFEIDNCIKNFPDEVLPDVLKLLCALGRNMTEQIKNFKINGGM